MKDLSIRISGTAGKTEEGAELLSQVNLDNAPLKEIHDTINAIYKFILDTADDVKECTVGFSKGSFLMNTHLPEKSAEFVENALKEDNFLPNDPYFVLLSSLERIARLSELDIDFGLDQKYSHRLTSTSGVGLVVKEPLWLKSELTVYGTVTNLGGKKPNVHFLTEDYGEIIVSIDVRTAQRLTVYKSYNFNLIADQDFDNLSEIKNIKFISMDEPVDPIDLDEYVRREQHNWSDIQNPTSWVRSVRSGTSDDN